MASKLLSFICHVPEMMPGTFPTTGSTAKTGRTPSRKTEEKAPGGHFTAIYENERFVRFKYISND